ncbi:hypothetical protein AXG93_3310s1120 [Marchantia polymorpha subsp. ruderalis]|uniref:Uncharacterized protein n=1 Tax=Marchantia polymorpha subsp. ruderalis TaxID=1480154 RepID=A0A176W282_MARPO|nr:hypothetical protein AXG93_3310s1120 [Marchantia polymorpha subsp. ruderalis]
MEEEIQTLSPYWASTPPLRLALLPFACVTVTFLELSSNSQTSKFTFSKWAPLIRSHTRLVAPDESSIPNKDPHIVSGYEDCNLGREISSTISEVARMIKKRKVSPLAMSNKNAKSSAALVNLLVVGEIH